MASNNLWRWVIACMMLVLGAGLAVTAAAAPLRESEEAAAPSLWLTPLEIHFGSVAIGGTATRTVTIRNTGNGPLQVDGGQVTEPFSVNLGTCASPLPGGGSCEITYAFRPRGGGDFAATAAGGSTAGPWAVAMAGRGVAPELQVSPRSLDFGRGPVGGPFAEQVVTVTNIGGVPVGGFRGDPATEPFTGGLGECTVTLQPGQSCRMTFDFVPENAGVFRREWTASSDAGPIAIEMQGRTYSGIDGTGQGVTPRAIDFGPVLVGQTIRQTVVFRNHDPNIPIVGWMYEWISDDPAIHFDFQENCGDVLAGNEECELTVSYRPRFPGREYAVLTVLNSQGIVNIELWGQGAGPDIVADSPAIDLGMAGSGRSNEQTIRFTNIGRARADLLGLQSAAAFAVTDSDCGDSLPVGGSCTASVRFQPHGFGRFEGVIELLTDRAPVPVHVYGGLATPALSVAFLPATVRQGGVSTLRLNIANPNPAQALFNVGVGAQLPPGLELTNDLRFSPECGDPVTVVDPTGSGFTLESATLTGGKTCVVEMEVGAYLSGVLRFGATAHSHAGPSNEAAAELTVQRNQNLTTLTFVPSAIGSPQD